jgi:hypothetical protein
MLANTKQVLSVFNSCNIVPNTANQRPGVIVAYATSDQYLKLLSSFVYEGYTNKVYRTSNMFSVKTQLA